MTTIRATWAVIHRNPNTGEYNILFVLNAKAQPDEELGTALRKVFADTRAQSPGPLWRKDAKDFEISFYQLAKWPCARKASAATIEAQFTKTITDDYVKNECVWLDESNCYEDVEKADNLLLVLKPLPDEHHVNLDTIHEEGRVDRDVVVHAARKRDSPSKGAELSTLKTVQKPGELGAVYNYRPLELSGPPIQIYHPVFANFLRAMENKERLGTADYDTAYHFVKSCVRLYDSEALRQDAMNAMSKAVHDNITNTANVVSKGKVIKPDGYVFTLLPDPAYPFRAATCIHEIKNEIGEGGSDPLAQAECCYVAVYCSEQAHALARVSPCPCILVGTAGPNIVVSGAIFADRFISQRLTGYISVVPVDSDELDGPSPLSAAIDRVGRLFRALKGAIAELNVYYANLDVPRSPLPPTQPPSTTQQKQKTSRASSSLPFIGPWFTEFNSVDGTKVTLKYTERLSDSDISRPVFKATATEYSVPDGGGRSFPVVVKFTRTYSHEGHELLAAHDPPLAPRLWYFGRLENTAFYVVVMDYVEHRLRRLSSTECMLLADAVNLLHERDLVFGDLREPNVLPQYGGGVMLIDFEWCGKDGEARYPVDIYMDDMPWHPTVRRDGLITKEHDLHLLRKLTTHNLEV